MTKFFRNLNEWRKGDPFGFWMVGVANNALWIAVLIFGFPS